jgi:hypothetical protein
MNQVIIVCEDQTIVLYYQINRIEETDTDFVLGFGQDGFGDIPFGGTTTS